MTDTERINELFDELVPSTGKADTEAGEIIRAICRLRYRWWNDGDKIGSGYGNKTCNAAARFLVERCDEHVAGIAYSMWGLRSDTKYEERLNRLESEVVRFLEEHPALRYTENSLDMFDYYDEVEDIEEEEDEEYEW